MLDPPPAKVIESEYPPLAPVRTDVPAEAPSVTPPMQPSHSRPATNLTVPVTTSVVGPGGGGGGGSVREGATDVLSPQAPARASDSATTAMNWNFRLMTCFPAQAVYDLRVAELAFRARFHSDRVLLCDECG